MSKEVLIVGAGPTGLVLAISLSRYGIPFTIIDQNAGPGRTSRAMAVHARVLEFYRQLGLAERIIEEGVIVDSISLFRSRKQLTEIPFGRFGHGMSPYPFILTLPQDLHEEILAVELRKLGKSVNWHHRLVHFEESGDSVEAVIETPKEMWRSGLPMCAAATARAARSEKSLEFLSAAERMSKLFRG